MAIIDTLANLNKYIGHYSCYNEIFSYLNQAIKEGSSINQGINNSPIGSSEKSILTSDIFAMEQKFNSKLREQCFLESHQKFIDIQLGILGHELMEHTHISHLEIGEDNLADKDYLSYKDYIHTNKIIIEKGLFAIFFPEDAHMGGQVYQKSELCMKTVVKVPVEYLIQKR
jgi:YhcH/YjgK/YiaL family protein